MHTQLVLDINPINVSCFFIALADVQHHGDAVIILSFEKVRWLFFEWIRYLSAGKQYRIRL